MGGEFYKILKEMWESIEKEEDEDKKVIRSYAWLSLQCLFEIRKLYDDINETNKKLLREIRKLNNLLKEFKEKSSKEETILDYIKLVNEKIDKLNQKITK